MSDSIKCPFCSEAISQEAKKCKHCGEFVNSFISDNEVEINEQINAFTKAGRQEILEQKKKKMESIGFRFISYNDNGVSSSIAKFIGPKDKKPKSQLIPICLTVFGVILVLAIIGGFFGKDESGNLVYVNGQQLTKDQIIVYYTDKPYNQQELTELFGKLDYLGPHPFRNNVKLIYAPKIDMTFSVNYDTDTIMTVMYGKLQ